MRIITLAASVALGTALFAGCGSSGSASGGSGAGGAGPDGSSTGGAPVGTGGLATGNGGASTGGGGVGGALLDGGSLAPAVTILHPGAGVDRTVNVSIYFHATATDPTDGTLSGSALVWTDSLEGQFGTGDPVNWAPTQTGSHTITLQATDSLGYTTSASITFNIVP